MDASIVPILISGVLGGGLFLGIAALYRAITESKEKKTLADSVGAKTPAEIESVSVATMTKALESAQTRIEALESERNSDRAYYQERIATLEQERTSDRAYYQERILELNNQLEALQMKLQDLAQELADAISGEEHV